MTEDRRTETLLAPPEQGQLVEVRRRQWIVSDVAASGMPVRSGSEAMARRQHLITLSSIEEDALGEELRIIWEIEPGARILEKAGLPSPTGFDDPRRLEAFLDAVRWGAATNADARNLQAPFRSGIAIEDYQLEPLVRSLDMPRANLLIADDVGLGKTIEAGLVVQELMFRHRARSVLIVCPASLQEKWRVEMLEKFGLEFRIVNTAYLRNLRRKRGIHTNPWTSFPRLIASIDWLKNDIPLRLMTDALPIMPTYPRRFDVLIVDEAHNVAPAGSMNYAVDSLRTKAIRKIAPHFEHRLFLTATPHNGFRESFTSLLEILDDQRFALGIVPDPENLARTMVRRLKSDIVDENGKAVFPERVLEPLGVDYADEERRIHAALVEYTASRRETTAKNRHRFATEFVLKLLKKRLFSSPAAFAATLEKHQETLRKGHEKAASSKIEEGILRRKIRQTEEDYADDKNRDEAEEDAIIEASRAFEELTPRETALLKEMTDWAEKARHRADAKAEALLEWLSTHIKRNGEWTGERVIIFTEYLATQKWLIDILTSSGYGGQDRLMTIYGGMDKDRREAIKAAFQASPNDSSVRILVATDAASEGIDLQNHCNKMIHIEIPWNPNVLEQRNGRVDRHGQRCKTVHIWHPVGSGYQERKLDSTIPTGDIEGDLEFLMVAARKIESIRTDLGSVGPIIAKQVEEAMLGERQRFMTEGAERKAETVRRQLPVEKRLRERVERLHERLSETREGLRISPLNTQAAVEVALDLAKQPALRPIDRSGIPKGKLFEMPALQGTWARCTEGLAHPHTGVRRPITFDHEVAKGRDDVVLVHLNHRLVVMALRLLRAEVFALEDVRRLHRVTAYSVPRTLIENPVVAVWSRLLVTGGKSQCLHEELTVTGGQIRQGRFSRVKQTQLDSLLKAGIPGAAQSPGARALQESWEQIEESVFSASEARTRDRMQYLGNTLQRQKVKEIEDIRSVLEDLRTSILSELTQPEVEQLGFWTSEEQQQLERNINSLEARAKDIPNEIEKEVGLIEQRYEDLTAHTFPVAIAFLIPHDAEEVSQ